MSSFLILTIQYMVLIIFNLLDTATGSIVQIISKLIVGLCYIYAFPVMWTRSKKIFIITYSIVFFLFLNQYLFFFSNREILISLSFPFFFISIPAVIYTLSLRDYKIFLNIFRKTAKGVFVIGVVFSLFIFSGNSNNSLYSMSFSYYMLLPGLLFIGDFIEKYKISSLMYSLITIIIIVALGARGPLLCILVFIFFKMTHLNTKNIRKDILFKLSSLSLIFLLTIQFDNIIHWLSLFLGKYGIYSRTLFLLQQGEVELSGRDNISNQIMSNVMESPLVGIGVGGDRLLTGTYSHNLFVEILSGWGFIIGGITIIGIILLIIRAYIISNKFMKNILAFWISIGFVHLMVSSTYITEFKFWIFIGIVISLNLGYSEKRVEKYE